MLTLTPAGEVPGSIAVLAAAAISFMRPSELFIKLTRVITLAMVSL
jgi:hypothetical protein